MGDYAGLLFGERPERMWAINKNKQWSQAKKTRNGGQGLPQMAEARKRTLPIKLVTKDNHIRM